MNEVFDYDRAAARIGHHMVWIAAVGAVAGWAASGWRWAGGFLLGAAISAFNYHWLKKLVAGLGSRPRKSGALGHMLRFVLLAAAAYAILRFSPINVLAVLVGLFVLIAAVFVETAHEIYARK
jgi:hypothetical protein